ncbi:MAG: hypothetical protein LBR00_00035, partial [Clostridiales Family XIII bacterium]|nr:hypothetical protein [Clostridiales Family XIII bacterium]
MTTYKQKATEYLAEGHAYLRRHGLWDTKEAGGRLVLRVVAGMPPLHPGSAHAFALERALALLPGDYPHAAEVAASLQALYEAKRLVTPRSSLEGKRILLGDYFLSLAVNLSLPLQNPALTALVVREMNLVGEDASKVFGRAS